MPRSLPWLLVALLAVLPTAAAIVPPCFPAPTGTLPWIDCNGDGTIGMMSLHGYPSQLLLSHTFCPASLDPNSLAHRYNNGTCVFEKP